MTAYRPGALGAVQRLRRRGVREVTALARLRRLGLPQDQRLQPWLPTSTGSPASVPSSPAPRASIIIPVFNHWESTRQCLAALASQSIAASVEVIVVDDGSSDDTKEAASAYMDATTTKVFGRLQGELSTISSLVHVLATSSSVADSNERSETGRAIPLFKAALQDVKAKLN